MLYMFEIVQSMMSSTGMYSVIYNLKTLSTGNICKSKVKVNTGILPLMTRSGCVVCGKRDCEILVAK